LKDCRAKQKVSKAAALRKFERDKTAPACYPVHAAQDFQRSINTAITEK